MSNPINHGSNNDRNIIAQVVYDKGGRITSIRDPKGNLTQYQYDLLGRPKQTTNPLSKVWTTTYTDVMNMGSPTGERQTSITDPNGVSTQQDFDRLGRVASISYGTPANTPDVGFSYNELGHLTTMTETGASSAVVRETDYNYDALGRVTAVDFDTDGNGTTDETISYEYDAGGLRTKMTLPGSLDINYEYDENGQLIRLTDWDSQATQFAYDRLGRHIATKRDNGLRTRYGYDAGGRLRLLRHTSEKETLGHFAYETDAVGNRTQALEVVPHTGAGTTTISHDDDEVTYRGTWSTVGGYQETSVFSASLELMFFGDETVSLKMGEGPNHSLYDIYLNGALWKTIDGYAASNAERTISIDIQGDGPHKLEVRNRPQHSKSARDAGGFDPSDYTLRFKSLSVDGTYDLHTILYSYDTVYRLLDAAYYAGHNTGATAFHQYEYDFDVAGNRTQQVQTIAGAPTTTNYTYNAGNQLTGDGTNTYTYDNNGNLTNDGTNTYTSYRNNKLKSATINGVTTSYTYDGMGRRIAQTVDSIVTDYLLDVQPQLAQVIASTTGANTERYIHSPRGIHAMENSNGDWSYLMQDGLGSVRAEVDANNAVLAMQNYEPYGDPFGASGTFGSDFGFTGEQTDGNGQVYLRARYYNPDMGVFTGLDPFEGLRHRPMSLNGYSWVEGNVINAVDPSGMCQEVPDAFWMGLANQEIPIPTGHSIESITPGTDSTVEAVRGSSGGTINWNFSWQNNGNSGDSFTAYEWFANTDNATYYIYTQPQVYGTCNESNKDICAQYTYTGLYSMYKLRMGRAPKFGELISMVFRGELGILVDFLGDEGLDALSEAFGRNFYSVVGTTYSYENLIDFLKDSQFWIDRSSPESSRVRTRITSGRYRSLLGITTSEFLSSGIENLEFTDVAQAVLDSEDWQEGQIPGHPARWGNKIYRKKRLSDNSVVELTQDEMVQWIINNTNANQVFASGDATTCGAGTPNAGNTLIGVVVDSADIGVETCNSENLSLVVSSDSYQG